MLKTLGLRELYRREKVVMFDTLFLCYRVAILMNIYGSFTPLEGMGVANI